MKTFDEQWKPVEGYEGLYEVSSLGRVKSLGNDKSRKEKVLKTKKHRGGYLFLHLCRNGKMKNFYVHRLVATAFIPNPEGLTEVNHKDEVKDNNCVSNLEWCNRSYNVNYGTLKKRISKAVEASKYPDFSEICLKFPSTREADRNGYKHQIVSASCNGCYCSKGNFYKNLYWRFAS